jgi:hypothetical protein
MTQLPLYIRTCDLAGQRLCVPIGMMDGDSKGLSEVRYAHYEMCGMTFIPSKDLRYYCYELNQATVEGIDNLKVVDNRIFKERRNG